MMELSKLPHSDNTSSVKRVVVLELARNGISVTGRCLDESAVDSSHRLVGSGAILRGLFSGGTLAIS